MRAYINKTIRVFGGKQYRPLLHVKDSARAIFENLNSKPTGIFNLNKQNVKILDLSKKIKKHFPNIKIVIEDIKFEDSRNYRVESKKAEKILNFKPKYTIDQGIEDLKKLLEENRVRDVSNVRYVNQMFLTTFNTHLQKV